MYKTPKYRKSAIKVNESVEGETLETKLERIMENKEPIVGEAPLIYTEPKDGVMAGYDIRTDRFEVALDAIGKIDRSNAAKRERKAKLEVVKEEKEVTTEAKKAVGGESEA